jgi:hypothetical protein
MPQGRRSLCALVALAILAALVLSGCGGVESVASSTAPSGDTSGGVSEELEGGLSREDSEAELKEIVDRETTPEERQELREGVEEGGQPEGAGEQEEQAREAEEPEREEAQ